LDWKKRGIWEKMFGYIKIQLILGLINSSAGYKKNSQEEQCLGRSRGGYGTKVHVLTDGEGNPL
jgi:hypothetical protein